MRALALVFSLFVVVGCTQEVTTVEALPAPCAEAVGQWQIVDSNPRLASGADVCAAAIEKFPKTAIAWATLSNDALSWTEATPDQSFTASETTRFAVNDYCTINARFVVDQGVTTRTVTYDSAADAATATVKIEAQTVAGTCVYVYDSKITR